MTKSLVRTSSVLIGIVALSLIVFATAGVASANPPGKPTIWVDGTLYNAIIPMSPHGTVQFPHVPDSTAPAAAGLETTDDLYIVGTNVVTPLVSDAAQGDSDYNGGRWLPRMVTPTGAGPVPELTSEEDIVAAATAGLVTISNPGGVFLCPVVSKVR